MYVLTRRMIWHRSKRFMEIQRADIGKTIYVKIAVRIYGLCITT